MTITDFTLTPDTRADELHALAATVPDENLCAIAKHPNVRLDTLRVVLDRCLQAPWDDYPLCAVARNPMTTTDMLDDLARVGMENVSWDVAEHPQTSADTLDVVLAQDFPGLAVLVAEHANTDEATLTRLLDDPYHAVVRGVLDNPSMPLSVLEGVVANGTVVQRRAAASAERTTPALLTHLAGDVDGGVRERVVLNTSTPVATVLGMTADVDAPTRFAVMRRLADTHTDVVRDMLLQETADQVTRFLNDKDFPVALFTALAGHADPMVRRHVAADHRTPTEALAVLLDDDDRETRWTCSFKDNTPVDALVRFLDDDDEMAVYGASGNSAVPIEIITRRADVSPAVVFHKDCPPNLLARFHDDDDDDDVVAAVAQHPNTPVEILEALLDNDDVCDLAAANLASRNEVATS